MKTLDPRCASETRFDRAQTDTDSLVVRKARTCPLIVATSLLAACFAPEELPSPTGSSTSSSGGPTSPGEPSEDTGDPSAGTTGGEEPAEAPFIPASTPRNPGTSVYPLYGLLGAAGEQSRLYVLDDAGDLVEGVTWSSSKPEEISVTEGGTVTAVTDIGSAMVTATIDGAVVDSVLVSTATPSNGTRLFAGADLVGIPTVLDDGGGDPLSMRFEATFRPEFQVEVGDAVVPTDAALLLGRVISAEETAEGTRVTVETVEPEDLFDAFSIDVVVQPSVLAARSEGPVYRSGSSSKRGKLGEFSCARGPKEAISLESSGNSVDVTLGALRVVDTKFANDRVVSYTLPTSFGASSTLEFAVTGVPLSIDCKYPWRRPAIPLSWLSMFVRPEVEVGLRGSAELGAASARFVLGTKSAVDLEVGLVKGDAYTMTTDLRGSLDTSGELVDSSFDAGVRVDLGAKVQGYAELQLVSPIWELGSLVFGAEREPPFCQLGQAYGGLEATGVIASPSLILNDGGFAAGMSADVKVGVKSEFASTCLFGGKYKDFLFTPSAEETLYNVANAGVGELLANITVLEAGEPVSFTVTHDLDSNLVDEVILWRQDAEAAEGWRVVDRQVASGALTIFTWTPTQADADAGTATFAATYERLGFQWEVKDDSRVTLSADTEADYLIRGFWDWPGLKLGEPSVSGWTAGELCPNDDLTITLAGIEIPAPTDGSGFCQTPPVAFSGQPGDSISMTITDFGGGCGMNRTEICNGLGANCQALDPGFWENSCVSSGTPFYAGVLPAL